MGVANERFDWQVTASLLCPLLTRCNGTTHIAVELTGAGHGSRVHVGAVVALLARTLGGSLLVGVAVRWTLAAVAVHGRSLVSAWSASCKTKGKEP